MFSFPLYRQGMKGSWKVLLVFTAVLTMYITIIISMYDPHFSNALEVFSDTMPELMAMMGMTPAFNTLTGFMSAYLYGFIMLVVPMVCAILTANRLVARQVDHGSMAYLLAAPVPRRKVVFTQMMVLLTGIMWLVLYATALGIACCEMLFRGELAIGHFIVLNLGALALQLFIGAICFFFSCLFNDTKYAIAFGAGIPALGYIIQMIANYGGNLENYKYATFFTLFDADGLVTGQGSAMAGMAALFAGAVILYTASTIVFTKKDLHI